MISLLGAENPLGHLEAMLKRLAEVRAGYREDKRENFYRLTEVLETHERYYTGADKRELVARKRGAMLEELEDAFNFAEFSAALSEGGRDEVIIAATNIAAEECASTIDETKAWALQEYERVRQRHSPARTVSQGMVRKASRIMQLASCAASWVREIEMQILWPTGILAFPHSIFLLKKKYGVVAINMRNSKRNTSGSMTVRAAYRQRKWKN